MNIGFWMCIVFVPIFAIIGSLFAVFKEKAARFVSGFHELPKREQELYDTAALSKDMRNSYFLWTGVMLIGAMGAWAFTGYFAILAYAVWGVLFFREVHFDAHQAFAKYRKE